MSHQEMATLEYAGACIMLLDDAIKRIDDVAANMESIADGSKSLMDDDLRRMFSDLVDTAYEVKSEIAARKGSIGEMAYARQVDETRMFLEIVNSVVMRASAFSNAIDGALRSNLANHRGRSNINDYLSKVESPDVRRMMLLLSKNPSHDGLSLDELRELAECRVDPSKKVRRKLVEDTVSELRSYMEFSRVISDVIDDVIGKEESISPLEMMNSAVNEVMDETLRRSAIQAIVKSISARGFSVRRENIRHIKGTNTVSITAIKPGGQKAEFSIDLDGKFIYHFQGYEGRACEKDIEPLEKDLEEVYGIKITDRKTLWINPDKLNQQHHAEMKVRRDS